MEYDFDVPILADALQHMPDQFTSHQLAHHAAFSRPHRHMADGKRYVRTLGLFLATYVAELGIEPAGGDPFGDDGAWHKRPGAQPPADDALFRWQHMPLRAGVSGHLPAGGPERHHSGGAPGSVPGAL